MNNQPREIEPDRLEKVFVTDLLEMLCWLVNESDLTLDQSDVLRKKMRESVHTRADSAALPALVGMLDKQGMVEMLQFMHTELGVKLEQPPKNHWEV